VCSSDLFDMPAHDHYHWHIEIIGRIERAAGRVAYNYFLHTQPFDMPAHDHYHWHIEIIPRLTKVAGFEWGTGCFINAYPPESAAAELRGG